MVVFSSTEGWTLPQAAVVVDWAVDGPGGSVASAISNCLGTKEEGGARRLAQSRHPGARLLRPGSLCSETVG